MRSIVLLRETSDHGCIGTSTAEVELSAIEADDLQRYIDATRGEILFARGVLLVEGQAEVFIIPAFAETMGVHLDHYGISVCSINGIDFIPYLKLIGPSSLNIPFSIVTDGDPDNKGISSGLRRGIRCLRQINQQAAREASSLFEKEQFEDLESLRMQHSIFVGERTLEIDILNNQCHKDLVQTFRELSVSSKALENLETIMEKKDSITEEDLKRILRYIDRIGKGRFSQRLASRIKREHIPLYIEEAITSLIDKVKK